MEPVTTSGSATLVIVWRAGRAAGGRVVKAGGEVVAVLREFAARAAATVAAGGGRHYDPDQEQDEAPFVELDPADLLDNVLLEQIRRGASLPLVTPSELRAHPPALYALLVGDDPAARTAFIRARSPLRLASAGLITVLDQTLTRVEQPVLAFDEDFDVIVGPEQAWALNQSNFERLFRESEAVLARTGEWVDQLAEVLPLAQESREFLTGRLRHNSVLRRKILSVLRKPYLPSLTVHHIAAAATHHHIDPCSLITGDELLVTADNERDLLHLLNEDLFVGDFSGSEYAAGRKTPRPT